MIADSTGGIMRKGIAALILLIAVATASQAASAYTATGTISGTIVSTSITISNQELGNMVANDSLYYYWNGSGTNYVTDSSAATNSMKFATVDFATDSGNVNVDVATNNSLPNTAKILVEDDNVPNSNTSTDTSQIQLAGNESMIANIDYAGANSDNKISYNSDGDVYVFFNTGQATEGDANVDITLTAS